MVTSSLHKDILRSFFAFLKSSIEAISNHLSSHAPSRIPLSINALFPLDGFLTRTPLVLQRLVKRLFVDVLAPPFAPTGEEDLLRISGEIVPGKCSQDALSAWMSSPLATVKPEADLHIYLGDETYLPVPFSHQACPWSTS